MGPPVGVADVRPRGGWRARAVAIAGSALILVVAPLHLHSANAQCPAGATSCVVEDGDNESEIDISQNNQGGDGVAGSQNIGVAGASGDVDITANNSSRFSRARGGDAVSKTVVEGQAETASVVEGSTVTVTSDASGVSQVTQTATPNVSADIEQGPMDPDAIPATGESVFSSTVSAALDSTVTQEASIESSPEATSIAAPAVVLPTVVQEGRNKVTIRSSGSSTSGDAIAGGQVISVVAVTGETRIIATNRSVFATARSGDAVANLRLSAAAGPQLLIGDSELAVSAGAHDLVTVGQTGAPESSISTGADGVDITSAASTTQTATVQSQPTAIALAGEHTVGANLIHEGDNVVDLDLEAELAAGDAVAGSQIIALAGVDGEVTIEANNNSRFARARGGDAVDTTQIEARSGPTLEVDGDAAEVEAVAMGATEIVQTATPNVSIDVTGSSTGSSTSPAIGAGNLANATGSAPVVQSATAVVSPTAVASAGSLAGTEGDGDGPGSTSGGGSANAVANAEGAVIVVQTANPSVTLVVTQTAAPTGTVDGAAPILSIDGSNTATLTGSAPVHQTAEVTAGPSATANG
ncbi:MAG: hypothetical protein WD646_00795 [Actinomycetota bacterium]